MQTFKIDYMVWVRVTLKEHLYCMYSAKPQNYPLYQEMKLEINSFEVF